MSWRGEGMEGCRSEGRGYMARRRGRPAYLARGDLYVLRWLTPIDA